MDAGLCVPPAAGATVGATDCPKPGVAAADTNVASKRKFRLRTVMLSCLTWFRQLFLDECYTLCVCA